jgi:intracellular sulfur oxidation DsrE/DsrF family protein
MKRAFFLSTGILSTLPVPALGSGGIPGGESLVEPRSAFDLTRLEATLGRPAQVKQMWENVALRPGVFGNIKNALNGLIYGFGYAPHEISMAVVNHGPSSAYTYDDGIWMKYRIAEFLNYPPASEENPFASAAAHVAQSLGFAPTASPMKNVFYPRRNAPGTSNDPDDETGPYQDTSIAALQARGVAFLLCHTAVVEQSRALVRSGYTPAGMSAGDVCRDILSHLVPGTVVVPSGVATVAVLQQRFGYTYITIQS